MKFVYKEPLKTITNLVFLDVKSCYARLSEMKKGPYYTEEVRKNFLCKRCPRVSPLTNSDGGILTANGVTA